MLSATQHCLLCLAIACLGAAAAGAEPERNRFDNSKSTKEWLSELQSKEPARRLKSAEVLVCTWWNYERGNEAVLQALLVTFGDKDEWVRGRVAWGLAKEPKALPALIRALKDPSPMVRSTAARSLWLMDERAACAPVLLDCLKAGNRNVCCSTIDTLREIGADAKFAVPALTETLEYKDEMIRSSAAAALGAIGKAARPSLPALRALLKDADPSVRIQSAQALWTIDASKAGVPLLRQEIRSVDQYVRRSAALAMEGVGSGAPEMLPELLGALKDDWEYVRWSAVRTLAQFEKSGPLVVPALEAAAVKDFFRYVRIEALWSLGKLGPKAEAGVPTLVASLKDPDPSIRSFAAEAIGEIGGERAHAAVDQLITMLKDKEYPTAVGVRAALIKLDPEAARKLGLLRQD